MRPSPDQLKSRTEHGCWRDRGTCWPCWVTGNTGNFAHVQAIKYPSVPLVSQLLVNIHVIRKNVNVQLETPQQESTRTQGSTARLCSILSPAPFPDNYVYVRCWNMKLSATNQLTSVKIPTQAKTCRVMCSPRAKTHIGSNIGCVHIYIYIHTWLMDKYGRIHTIYV